MGERYRVALTGIERRFSMEFDGTLTAETAIEWASAFLARHGVKPTELPVPIVEVVTDGHETRTTVEGYVVDLPAPRAEEAESP